MSAKQVAKVENTPVVTVDPTPLTMIAQVIENPDFDVDKLDKMMQLQERFEDRQAIKSFNQALSSFQEEVPRIHKGKKGVHDIMYAPLETVMGTIQPFLSKHGLAVRFSTRVGEGSLYLEAVCTISHRDGHSETSSITVPIDSSMKANSSQKMGSANSYAKRYALANALNLAFTENDDDAGALYAMITEDQAIEIEDLLKETKSDKAAFLKWAGVAEVELIRADHYQHAVSTLRRKMQ